MSVSYSLAGSERRGPSSRRGQNLIDAGVEKRSDRRDRERRDSPRALGRFWVRDPSHGGISEVYDGDLSLNGASFVAMHPPHGTTLEVGMWLPGQSRQLHTTARVIHRGRLAGATTVQVRFEQMSPAFSAALALYLLEQEQQQ
jgi:hypothetical protein